MHLSIAHLGKADSVLTLILQRTSSDTFNNNWSYKDTLIKGQDFKLKCQLSNTPNGHCTCGHITAIRYNAVPCHHWHICVSAGAWKEEGQGKKKKSQNARWENKEGVTAALTLAFPLNSRVVSMFFVMYTDTDVSALKLWIFVCVVALAAL